MNPAPLIPLKREVGQSEIDRAQASVAEFAAAVAAAKEKAGPDATVVAWMSDLHIHAPRPYADLCSFYATDVDCSANLQIALAEFMALEPRPDVLLLGGDLTDCGANGPAFADEYADLKRVLDEGLPVGFPAMPLLGNHDHSAGPLTPEWNAAWKKYRRPEWPSAVEPDDFYYAATAGGWRFRALDSRADEPLSDRQYRWLETELQDETAPTVVLVHRPFVAVGNWVDRYSLEDRRTFDLLDGCPAVKLVLSGHTHKAAYWDFRNARHVVFPACAYGLPDTCGWGVVVLGGSHAEAVFVKDLATPYFDGVAMRPMPSEGAFRELQPGPFADSPLCNPCVMPHRLIQ